MKPLFAILALGMALPSAHAAEFDAAGATNHVGLEVYRQLAAQKAGENLVISPSSLESALALAYVGAEGATRNEMAKVLRFPADDDAVVTGAAALRKALEQVATNSKTIAAAKSRSGGRVDPIE